MTLESYQKRIKFFKDAQMENDKRLVKEENDRQAKIYQNSSDSVIDDKKLLEKIDIEAASNKKFVEDRIAEESRKPAAPIKEVLNRSSTNGSVYELSGEKLK